MWAMSKDKRLARAIEANTDAEEAEVPPRCCGCNMPLSSTEDEGICDSCDARKWIGGNGWVGPCAK